MQAGNLLRVRSRPATDWTSALAQNASEALALPLPEAIAAGKHCRARIRAIDVVSSDNLAWELLFFTNSRVQLPIALASDGFCGRARFTEAEGGQVGLVLLSNYYYHRADLNIPYEDTDLLGRLNVVLVNRSPIAKTAASAGGEFLAIFTLEGTLGW